MGLNGQNVVVSRSIEMLEKLEVNVSIMCLKVTYMFKVGYS
jgi:hypothetical protein